MRKEELTMCEPGMLNDAVQYYLTDENELNYSGKKDDDVIAMERTESYDRFRDGIWQSKISP